MPMYAHRRMHSERSFNRQIAKNKFVVVLLYELSRECCKDRAFKDRINTLEYNFDAASRSGLYEQAKVLFLSGNMAKKDLSNIFNELQTKTLPVVALYHNGVLVEKSDGAPATHGGFFSAKELKEFIDKYLKKEMRTYAQWRSKEEQKRSCSSGIYYYPYGWYYPYSYPWRWGTPWYYW
jgi:hypothetical protein